MTNNATPAPPGDIDPRHVFRTAKEVILRYGWGRTYGYRMLKSTGFPRRIGDRYRLGHDRGLVRPRRPDPAGPLRHPVREGDEAGPGPPDQL